MVSCLVVQLFVVPWTIVHHAPLPMAFSRQKYLSVVPFPTPVDLSSPGIKPTSFAYPALAGDSLHSHHWEAEKRREIEIQTSLILYLYA